MDLIQKVKELIAALRANDWTTAISLTLAILMMIAQGMQGPRPMTATHRAASDAHEVKTLDELATELEECCKPYESTTESFAAASVQGKFTDLLLPIMLALLKKLIGF